MIIRKKYIVQDIKMKKKFKDKTVIITFNMKQTLTRNKYGIQKDL